MAQSCYACCAQLQCLPPARALVIAVWTALLKTPLLARCAARCAVYLWGKNPQFADRYMCATADACVVCDNMNRATSHSCMHHVLTRLHRMPNRTSCSRMLVPVCNSLALWCQPCSQTHLSICSHRCLRQRKETRRQQQAHLQALHLLAGTRTRGRQSSEVTPQPSAASGVELWGTPVKF